MHAFVSIYREGAFKVGWMEPYPGSHVVFGAYCSGVTTWVENYRVYLININYIFPCPKR